MSNEQDPSSRQQPPNRLGPRLVLVLLALLFLAPVLVAVFLNSSWSDFRPHASRNNGQLVDPPVMLNGSFRNPVGVVMDSRVFGERWFMLHVATGLCEDACAQRLDVLSRVHRTLGRHQSRVGLAQLSLEPPSPDSAGRVHQASQNIIQLTPVDGQAAQSLEQAIGGMQLSDGGVFLLDPGRYLILYYAPDATDPDGDGSALDSGGLRRDLQRLMRLSDEDLEHAAEDSE